MFCQPRYSVFRYSVIRLRFRGAEFWLATEEQRTTSDWRSCELAYEYITFIQYDCVCMRVRNGKPSTRGCLGNSRSSKINDKSGLCSAGLLTAPPKGQRIVIL